mmetsp:Transcript_18154/g.54588  ORF Transcript_18154/g.54588 Transcript_18154/m.54588 type:complete len:765 (-) Transcript_18154:275-2569(-)
MVPSRGGAAAATDDRLLSGLSLLRRATTWTPCSNIPSEDAAQCGTYPGPCVTPPRMTSFQSDTSTRGSETLEEGGPSFSAQDSADGVVQALAPRYCSAVRSRLLRERVHTAADLALLDKDDLRDIGLTMVERGRVLAWARDFHKAGFGAAAPGRACGDSATESTVPTPVSSAATFPGARDARDESRPPTRSGPLHQADIGTSPRERLRGEPQQADFWCGLVAAQQAFAQEPFTDLRENVLEDLFDVTPERVMEVYGDMRRGSQDAEGRILEAELGRGLSRCGLPSIGDASLARALDAVGADRGAGLRVAEFVAILTRLKLAQLLAPGGLCAEGRPCVSFGSPKRPEGVSLTAVDYNFHRHLQTDVAERDVVNFFFGHRHCLRSPEAPLVRWVHLCQFDLRTLLGLTVKYSLHPLGVEDVIEQCPTKMDRYESHYFLAVQQLSLVSSGGHQPVRVSGFHYSIFCSAPPSFETLITAVQPDTSFASDWPGGVAPPQDQDAAAGAGEKLAEKLRLRLAAPRSRLRERRADFLMYHIADLCADEFVALVRAYGTRLQFLATPLEAAEHEAAFGGSRSKKEAKKKPYDPCREVTDAKLQLTVVMRRVRGLHRMVRRLQSDPDLTAGLSRYLQDVADHLDEAFDDATQLLEKCSAIVEAHHRAVERCLEGIHKRSADRLNNMLFVLTLATFIFAPMQFLAGVYGMNFQDKTGKPLIPELNWRTGYTFFWLVILVYLVALFACSGYCFFRSHRSSRRDTDLHKSCEACDTV